MSVPPGVGVLDRGVAGGEQVDDVEVVELVGEGADQERRDHEAQVRERHVAEAATATPAPSTTAASFSSSGIDWSAPRQAVIMNGNASQVFRIRTETLAQIAIAEPRHVAEPDRLQELVQIAEVVVEDAAPGEDRDRRRGAPRG